MTKCRGMPKVLVALLATGAMGLAASPAHGAAPVLAVRGSAFGVSLPDFSLFGGDQMPDAAKPTVTLPPDGSQRAVVAAAPSETVTAGHGITTLFESGPVRVTSSRTPSGRAESVGSSTDIQAKYQPKGCVGAGTGPYPGNPGGLNLLGTQYCIYNGPFTATAVSSQCNASGAGNIGSTAIQGGVLVTSQDPATGNPKTTYSVPTNPRPNLTIDGTLELSADGSGRENFTYIFNEQTVNPDGSLTVNAGHEVFKGPVAVGDLFFGQAVCGLYPPIGSAVPPSLGGCSATPPDEFCIPPTPDPPDPNQFGTSAHGPQNTVFDSGGNLWFTYVTDSVTDIGMRRPDGTSAHFSTRPPDGGPLFLAGKPSSRPYGITTSTRPDGHQYIWFTDPPTGRIGRLDPLAANPAFDPTVDPTADPPGIIMFSVPEAGSLGSQPRSIAAGPDGGMWFTVSDAGSGVVAGGDVSKIGRIPADATDSNAIREYPVPTRNAGLEGITAGPDGNMWFAENATAKIGRVSIAGVPVGGIVPPLITEYTVGAPGKGGAHPLNLVRGADGKGGERIWFTESGTGRLGFISPQAPDPVGHIELGSGTAPTGITATPDGKIWVVETGRNTIVSIDPPTGHIRTFPPLPTPDSGVKSLAFDASGRTDDPAAGKHYIWYGESVFPKVGRQDVNAVLAPPAASGCAMPPGTLPKVVIDPDTPGCDIVTSGPLTNVVISPETNCQVVTPGTAGTEQIPHPANGVPGSQFYTDNFESDRTTKRAECGTFLAADGVLYGPEKYPCFEPDAAYCPPPPTKPKHYSPFVPVSQKGVTGKGTASDPFTIVTVVCAGTASSKSCDGTGVPTGATQIKITETDSYATGASHYSTSVRMDNVGATAMNNAQLYRQGSCGREDGDESYARYKSTTGGIACLIGNTNASRAVEWVPDVSRACTKEGGRAQHDPGPAGSLAPGGLPAGPVPLTGIDPAPGDVAAGCSHYMEDDWWLTESWTASLQAFPDVCKCSTSHQAEAGLNWTLSIAPGESEIRSHITKFDPLNRPPQATIADAAVSEPTTGGAGALFQVSLDSPPVQPVALDYTTSDGTAAAGEDYTATRGRLVFTPGQPLVQTFTVPVLGDPPSGNDEVFFASIAASNAGALPPPPNFADPSGQVPSGSAPPAAVAITRDQANGTITETQLLPGHHEGNTGGTDGTVGGPGSPATETSKLFQSTSFVVERQQALLLLAVGSFSAGLLPQEAPAPAQTPPSETTSQAQSQGQSQSQSQSQVQQQSQAQLQPGLMLDKQRQVQGETEGLDGGTDGVHLASRHHAAPISWTMGLWATAGLFGLGLTARGRNASLASEATRRNRRRRGRPY